MRCVACLEPNDTMLKLCPSCEEFYKGSRERMGLTVRTPKVLEVGSEPDD